MAHCVLVLLALVFAMTLSAQEVALLAGRTEPMNRAVSAHGWQMDLRMDLAPGLAWSGSYLNEGHWLGHKRDGLAAQVWGRIPLFDDKISLGLGGGLYCYWDTHTIAPGQFSDLQGWTALYSVSVQYLPDAPWFARLNYNLTGLSRRNGSETLLLGGGVRFGEPSARKTHSSRSLDPDQTGDEVVLFQGVSILNSLVDQKGLAAGVEFRKGLLPHMDWTFTWLYEGDPRVLRRNGAGSQVWLVGRPADQNLSLGFGLGAYAFLDHKRQFHRWKEAREDVAVLASLTTAYHFPQNWVARITWNRVATRNSRDTDNFVLGLGTSWRGD
jgi:hypothetical protein